MSHLQKTRKGQLVSVMILVLAGLRSLPRRCLQAALAVRNELPERHLVKDGQAANTTPEAIIPHAKPCHIQRKLPLTNSRRLSSPRMVFTALPYTDLMVAIAVFPRRCIVPSIAPDTAKMMATMVPPRRCIVHIIVPRTAKRESPRQCTAHNIVPTSLPQLLMLRAHSLHKVQQARNILPRRRIVCKATQRFVR